MSVIIKGLNKFNSCRLCPFNNSDCYCNITKGIIDRDDYSCESECPIVQLPKGHGRLIDADALKETFIEPNIYLKGNEKGFWCFTSKEIKNTPTIIEAEGSDKE